MNKILIFMGNVFQLVEDNFSNTSGKTQHDKQWNSCQYSVQDINFIKLRRFHCKYQISTVSEKLGQTLQVKVSALLSSRCSVTFPNIFNTISASCGDCTTFKNMVIGYYSRFSWCDCVKRLFLAEIYLHCSIIAWHRGSMQTSPKYW